MGSCVSSDDKTRLTSGHSSMIGKPSNGYKDLNSGIHCEKPFNPSTGSSLLSSSGGLNGGTSGAKLSSNSSGSSGLRSSSLISSPSMREDGSVSGLPSARSSSTSGHHHRSHGGHSATPSSHNQTVVTALYNYHNSKDEGDLSFNKGDRLLVIDDTDVDWWLAKNLSTNAKGYIPRNYVAVEVLETEEWVYYCIFRFLDCCRSFSCLLVWQ